MNAGECVAFEDRRKVLLSWPPLADHRRVSLEDQLVELSDSGYPVAYHLRQVGVRQVWS